MKLTTHRLRAVLGFAAISGLAMVPFAAIAQEPAPSPPSAAGGQKPDLGKVRGMVREMMELKRAGKHDEVNQMAERIKAATNNHPRVMEMLEHQKASQGPEGKASEPRKPTERPKAKDREHESQMKAKPSKDNKKESKKERKEAKNPESADIKPGERIRHLRVAAEHLDAAGISGMAKGVRAQIEGMEKRMKHAEAREGNDQAKSRGKRTESKDRHNPPGPENKVRPMRQGPRFDGTAPRWGGFGGQGPQAKPQPTPTNPNAALVGEIRKLRQEMGELRGQVNRLQAHAGQAPQRPPHPPAPPVKRPE